MAAGDAHLTRRLQPFTTTIFATMSELAAATGSVNLGQGFPDTDGPEELREVAVAAIREGRNQYPPGHGVPELRQAVAAHQRAWYGLDLRSRDRRARDRRRHRGHRRHACWRCASPATRSSCSSRPTTPTRPARPWPAPCRGSVRLHPPDWHFDPDELAAAVGPRTKLMLLNSPHNPTGKVFSPDELAQVAALCTAHDLLAVTDEVYEHLVFDGAHVPLATLPGMGERTLTISSGGKTFSFTGWKVGWVSGPAPLVAAVRAAKQFLTYTSPAPFQLAIARGLGFPPAVMGTPRHRARGQAGPALRRSRRRSGTTVFRPAATYFATTDISPVAPGLSAQEFCLALPERCGVVAIPSSVFYDPADPDAGRTLVRWAFCKRADVLDDALARLASWGP